MEQHSTNTMRSLCVSSVFTDDVHDAHRAGANRLQNKTTNIRDSDTKAHCALDTFVACFSLSDVENVNDTLWAVRANDLNEKLDRLLTLVVTCFRKFSLNFGPGKTECMIQCRGKGALAARGCT